MVVMTILGITVSIAVPAYVNFVENAAEQICNNNCLRLERMYHIHLLFNNRIDTPKEYNEFLLNYEGEICPSNGVINNNFGRVKCLLHTRDETNENDDSEGNGAVPYL